MPVRPRCEHCTYELTGIDVTNFIARCPECGRDSDVRRGPRPNIPWWHTPGAVVAGIGFTFAGFLACVLAERWGLISTVDKSRTSSWCGLACVTAGATFAIVLLRNDYRARWSYMFGPGKAPPRAWGWLLVDWIVIFLAVSLLPAIFFIGLGVLLGI